MSVRLYSHQQKTHSRLCAAWKKKQLGFVIDYADGIGKKIVCLHFIRARLLNNPDFKTLVVTTNTYKWQEQSVKLLLQSYISFTPSVCLWDCVIWDKDTVPAWLNTKFNIVLCVNSILNIANYDHKHYADVYKSLPHFREKVVRLQHVDAESAHSNKNNYSNTDNPKFKYIIDFFTDSKQSIIICDDQRPLAETLITNHITVTNDVKHFRNGTCQVLLRSRDSREEVGMTINQIIVLDPLADERSLVLCVNLAQRYRVIVTYLLYYSEQLGNKVSKLTKCKKVAIKKPKCDEKRLSKRKHRNSGPLSVQENKNLSNVSIKKDADNISSNLRSDHCPIQATGVLTEDGGAQSREEVANLGNLSIRYFHDEPINVRSVLRPGFFLSESCFPHPELLYCELHLPLPMSTIDYYYQDLI